MKDIKTLLNEMDLTVPTDKMEAFEKEFRENYRTIADYDKQKDKLAKANEQLTELNEKIGAIDLDEVQGLKEQIKDYETKETERAEAERKSKEDKELTDIVLSAIGEREFTNDYTKNAIIDQVKQSLLTETGKGATEIFEEITKDKDGIFKNPQSPVKLPPSTGGKGATEVDEYLEKKYANNPFFAK